MPIFEPPMLSINVPDKRYVHAIEACFGANDMQVRPSHFISLAVGLSFPQTFVAQCNEDYQLLNQLVADTPEALGRKARINTWYRDPTNVAPPPASVEEVKIALLELKKVTHSQPSSNRSVSMAMPSITFLSLKECDFSFSRL